MKKTMLCALAALSLPQLLLAADHDHDHHKQKAHVHGVAELAMVLEGSKLEVEIKSPAEISQGNKFISKKPSNLP